MEPAGVSGTVTISDQRLQIKIETLRGKNTTEIHSALSEVCMKPNRSLIEKYGWNGILSIFLFKVSSQGTIVRFLIWLIIFVVVV